MKFQQVRTAARLSQWLQLCFTAIVFTACALLIGSNAQAQPYPNKPIRFVVPYAAGSSSDSVARLMGPRLTQILGQQVVIDNKGGGGAIIGTQFVAQSPADGYTLLLGTGGTHAINKYLFKSLPYDPQTSFTPVARMAIQPSVFVVSGKFPFKSVPELVAYAKANPGKLSYGSIGIGSTVHLSGELFNSEAGTKIVHVPYKSAGQAVSGLLAGDIAMMFYPYTAVAQHIQSGALKAFATTGVSRASYLPNVPTMVELGYPDFTLSSWLGVYAPANLPPPIVEALRQAIQQVLTEPTMVQVLQQIGTEVYYAGPEEFAQFTRSEITRFKKIVEISGATAD